MIKSSGYILTFLIFLGLMSSCSNSDPSMKYKVKPSALGVMNEIVVISDDDIWTSIVGDTVRHFFGGAYPLTPRPEPLFDLRQYELKEIYSQPLKKELRTYLILANLDDTDSETTKFVVNDLGEERVQRARTESDFNTSIGRDKWATGQILIYIFAHGTDPLADALERNYNGIASRVNEHDAEQLKQLTFARGKNPGLESDMVGRFGAAIEVPADFLVALNAPDDHGLYWLRKDTKDGALNMAFRIYDYEDQKILSRDSAIARFNTFGKYVSSSAKNTYVVINDEDLPVLEFDRTISTRYTKEWRGIWEMENDFMGGPFMSYAIVNETKGKVLVIDAFIFSPGQKKRDMMQQIDLVAKNIKW